MQTAENTSIGSGLPQGEIILMVLIIDDEHALQEVMAEIMELAGLSSICASSGEEGAALYAEQYKDIGIVFGYESAWHGWACNISCASPGRSDNSGCDYVGTTGIFNHGCI
ncbi:MAG: hypothetical protein R2932_12190 [Caldilineaceae bacterium]